MEVIAHLCHNEKTINPRISFSDSSHIVYHNHQHIILELNLNAKGIVLLSYICEKMGQDNVILINDDFKRAYIDFIISIAKTSIDIKTVNSFVKKFEKGHLIIKHKDYPCLYIVNPKYFSNTPNTSNSKRKSRIEELLSKKYEGKINKEALLNKPLERFFEEK
jgi:hypothetical protein